MRAPAGEEVRWLLTPDVHSVARAAVPTVVEDAGERQPAAEVGGVDELLHQQVGVASGREPQPLDRREVQARNVHAACGATVHGAYGTGARTAYVQSSPPGASQPCAPAAYGLGWYVSAQHTAAAQLEVHARDERRPAVHARRPAGRHCLLHRSRAARRCPRGRQRRGARPKGIRTPPRIDEATRTTYSVSGRRGAVEEVARVSGRRSVVGVLAA